MFLPKQTMEKISWGISSYLLCNKVRYDGNHKHDHYITDTLGRYFEVVPVCPEVESGLSMPREDMRLVDDGSGPNLRTIKSSVNHSNRINSWSKEKVLGFLV